MIPAHLYSGHLILIYGDDEQFQEHYIRSLPIQLYVWGVDDMALLRSKDPVLALAPSALTAAEPDRYIRMIRLLAHQTSKTFVLNEGVSQRKDKDPTTLCGHTPVHYASLVIRYMASTPTSGVFLCEKDTLGHVGVGVCWEEEW